MSLWFGEAENTLFNNLGRELVETLITQHFTLYRPDPNNTETNFYGEAKRKVWLPAVDVKARISITDSDVVEEGGARRMGKGDMQAWVYLQHLSELNVAISVGNFIGFQGKVYEVYDNSPNKDNMRRKFAGDRNYFQEILAKVVLEDIFAGSATEQGYQE